MSTEPENPNYLPGSEVTEALLKSTEILSASVTSATIIADRYQLLDRIGEGGMGEVWVAQQMQPVKRRVAIKLIRPGMGSKAFLARFEQERQALALMDHPNIAKVLDAGVTSGGAPYLVMEHVSGEQLTKFCDAARLPPKARLELAPLKSRDDFKKLFD